MTLSELRTVQHAFDTSRGFADLPFVQGTAARHEDGLLGKLEFALMGLAGEVGEVAGILKRARRETVQSGLVDNGMPVGLESEIADVLAYVLKLATAADIDLEAAYLAKMALNAHRFRHRDRSGPRVHSLCGPPGSGKTSIARALAEIGEGDRAVYVERYESNTFLGDIQAPDRVFDADQSQCWFLSQMDAFLERQNDVGVVLDQDPTAIVAVYSVLLRDQGRLSTDALTRHLSRLVAMELRWADILAGRCVFLLDAPAAVLAERCADKFGGPPNVAFLSDLRDRFVEVFARLPNVTIVDTQQPLADVLSRVRTLLPVDSSPSCRMPAG